MIYSYDKVYLRIAQRVLGEMLNYAVYDCGYELNEYYRLFTESSYSERFSKGGPFVIAGMSGAELAIRVMMCRMTKLLRRDIILKKARNIGPDGCWHIING